MVRAAFAFSLMALCVKLAGRTLPSMEVVFFRSLIGTIIIVAIIRAKGIPLWGNKERGLMTLRGLSGFLALSLHFYTIKHLPIGTAVLLNYTAPIFAALLATLFLKEKTGLLRVVLILISFWGVSLLVEAKFLVWDRLIFLGLLSAFFTGIVYVSIRAIRGESPYTIIFYFTAVSTLGSVLFLPFGFRAPGLQESLILAALGVASFYGQYWFTLSLQKAPPAVVGPFSFLTPLLSFVYGMIFFGDRPTATSLAGCVLIILSGSLMTYLEARGNNITPSQS